MGKVILKINKVLPIGIAPLILMSYGWYLGQLHESGYDVAGILLFITGAVGVVLAFIFFLLTRKFPWHEKWVVNALIGLAGCGIVFTLIFVYARLHG
jgi:hypothetical protein